MRSDAKCFMLFPLFFRKELHGFLDCVFEDEWNTLPAASPGKLCSMHLSCIPGGGPIKELGRWHSLSDVIRVFISLRYVFCKQQDRLLLSEYDRISR